MKIVKYQEVIGLEAQNFNNKMLWGKEKLELELEFFL